MRENLRPSGTIWHHFRPSETGTDRDGLRLTETDRDSWVLLLGTSGYFCVLMGISENFLVLLGTFWYFLVLLGTFLSIGWCITERRQQDIEVEFDLTCIKLVCPSTIVRHDNFYCIFGLRQVCNLPSSELDLKTDKSHGKGRKGMWMLFSRRTGGVGTRDLVTIRIVCLLSLNLLSYLANPAWLWDSWGTNSTEGGLVLLHNFGD